MNKLVERHISRSFIAGTCSVQILVCFRLFLPISSLCFADAKIKRTFVVKAEWVYRNLQSDLRLNLRPDIQATFL